MDPRSWEDSVIRSQCASNRRAQRLLLGTNVNRRRTLRIVATTMAGLAVPRKSVAAETADPSPAMSVLSAYMGGAAGRPLPSEVIEHAKHHTLDTLAAMISGSELKPGQAALR